MEERYLIQEFNNWFTKTHDEFISSFDSLSTERITNSMLLFSYICSELKNQLKLKCVERGTIIDNLLVLYYESITSIIKVLDYKIKHHDVIKELTKSCKEKDKLINSLEGEIIELTK